MKKLFFFLACMLLSNAAMAQVEHGALVGGNAVFPLQDEQKSFYWVNPSETYTFQNWVRPQITVGYRFRFLPKERFFYDLDIRAGFQWTETHHYNPYYGYVWVGEEGSFGYVADEHNRSFHEFLVPISISASWNWQFGKGFHLGAGLAPTLYVSPNPVFDQVSRARADLPIRLPEHAETLRERWEGRTAGTSVGLDVLGVRAVPSIKKRHGLRGFHGFYF